MAFYRVVCGVDLGGGPPRPPAPVRLGEPVGVVALDELPPLSVHLFYGGAWHQAEPVVGGEDVRRVPPRERGGGAPPVVPLPCRPLPPLALLLGPAPLLGGSAQSGFECPPQGLGALAAGPQGLAEAFVLLEVRD